MNRLPIIAAAMSIAAMSAALPSAAAAQAIGYYVAVPVTLPAKARLETSGTPWFVRGNVVMAPRAPDRPARVCAMVAGKIGPLSAFSVAGKPFAADELATCNAAAGPKPIDATGSIVLQSSR